MAAALGNQVLTIEQLHIIYQGVVREASVVLVIYIEGEGAMMISRWERHNCYAVPSKMGGGENRISRISQNTWRGRPGKEEVGC